MQGAAIGFGVSHSGRVARPCRVPLGLPDRSLCHRKLSSRRIRPKEFNADSQGKRILIHL